MRMTRNIHGKKTEQKGRNVFLFQEIFCSLFHHIHFFNKVNSHNLNIFSKYSKHSKRQRKNLAPVLFKFFLKNVYQSSYKEMKLSLGQDLQKSC